MYAHTSSTFEKLTKKKRKGIQGIMLHYITAVVFHFFVFFGLLTGWRRRQHLCFLIKLSLIIFNFFRFYILCLTQFNTKIAPAVLVYYTSWVIQSKLIVNIFHFSCLQKINPFKRCASPQPCHPVIKTHALL